MKFEEMIKLSKEEQKKLFSDIKTKRSKGKTVNFASVYGVGVSTLSRNSGLSEKECKKLLEVYWSRNWAVKKFADNCIVKQIGAQKWVYNPISKFWYSLRADKDKFSTVNQSSAVFVFDTWLKGIRNYGLKISFQIHDEFSAEIENKSVKWAKEIVKQSMKEVNEELKLNVELGCDTKTGKNYIEIH